MAMGAFVRFSDIYPSNKFDLQETLKKIPSKAFLLNLAAIKAQLSAQYSDDQIIDRLLFNAPEYAVAFKNKVKRLNERTAFHCSVFSHLSTARLMLMILPYYNNIEGDTTNWENVEILKLYLWINEIESEKLDRINEENVIIGDDRYNKLTWPIMSEQYQFKETPNSILQAIRSMMIIDQLRKGECASYVKSYNNAIGMRAEIYLLELVKMISRIQSETIDYYGFKIPGFYLTLSEKFEFFLKNLCIEPDQVVLTEGYDSDFLALKKYPIMRTSIDKYTILDWNLLKKSLYSGFIFDFYGRSGITIKYPSFPDFKSFLGREVSESRIFRPILSTIYDKKHHRLYFDDNELGYPDAYLRIGKRIFIFEYKDYMFPSRVALSHDYEKMRKEIHLKFIGNKEKDPKGIMQLLRAIEKLNEEDYPFDSLDGRKTERGKLEIYPIIVYTDFQYSMPGVNSYLIDYFNKQKGNYKFKKVYKPVMISMDFFFDHMEYLRKHRLDQLIKDFLKIRHSKKRLKIRFADPNKWAEENLSFEYLINDKVQNIRDSKVFEKFSQKCGIDDVFRNYNSN